MAYAFLTAVLLGAFWAAPNVAWMQWLIVAAVGFALYGPQMLIGLCGAEVVRKPAVSAAQGFLGWISYLGAPRAGTSSQSHCHGAGAGSAMGIASTPPLCIPLCVKPLIACILRVWTGP